MKRLLGVTLMAVVLAAIAAQSAHAGYCGAASFQLCCASDACNYTAARQNCYTVMKCCKEVVYEKQNYTCYKTVCCPVMEQKTIDCVKYVAETAYKTCEYTVC